MPTEKDLHRLSKKIASQLRQTQTRLVLCESCTGGRVAASLAQIPGISRYFCGSAVVYRDDTKYQWLEIPKKILKNPGPVSSLCALKMAAEILAKTPEANFSLAITGYLGPDSPRKKDGQIFIAFALRQKKKKSLKASVVELRFPRVPKITPAIRVKRQLLASHCVLLMVRLLLNSQARKSKLT